MTKLEKGKIPDEILSELLGKYTNIDDSSVLLGPALGEDAGIVQLKGSRLAICVDPIMVNIQNSPYFAVAVNVNDLVTRGARPQWASASVFFPEYVTVDDVDTFFRQLYDAVQPHNISIVTGHTEITSLVNHPGIVMTLFGEVETEDYITTGGAQVGDDLVLTGGAGIEGTVIIAADLSDKLNVGAEIIDRAKKFLFDPGICVAEAAYVAWTYKPSALHDPTEGGVRKGIEEMAIASGVGVRIEYDDIPILNETKIMCDAAGVDPLGIFGSGALLISIPREKTSGLLEAYTQKGILARVIGKVFSHEYGRILVCDGKEEELKASYTDGLIGDIC